MEIEQKIKSSNKPTIVSIFILIILIPFTIFLGWRFGDRQYYITSLLIIMYTMIPFVLMFEKRKPQARELLVIAVMCAIAVASRTAFIWIPHFKPMAAIIIITGISLGAETGFLTGAVSAFVSDFIFGQGPWTPWQMLAFGIVGFLSGFLYRKGMLKKEKFPLCIFGGAVTILIIGFILDTCAIFTMSSVITRQGALAIYLSGLPVNIIQASATVITLFLVSVPMFEKLDRIKLKYGMMEG